MAYTPPARLGLPLPDMAAYNADLAEVVAAARKWEIVQEMDQWSEYPDLPYWVPSIIHLAEEEYARRYESAKEGTDA